MIIRDDTDEFEKEYSIKFRGETYKFTFEGKVTPHNDVIERLLNNRMFNGMYFEQSPARIAEAMQVHLRNYEEEGCSVFIDEPEGEK